MVDGKGKTYEAPLFFTSSGQVNFQIPEAVPVGGAVIRVVKDGVTLNSSPAMITSVEPGMFTVTGDGNGLAAGLAIFVAKDGTQKSQFLARYDEVQSRYVAVPITVPTDGSAVVLSLFGTGARGHGDLSKVTATVGGFPAEVSSQVLRENSPDWTKSMWSCPKD